MTSIYKVEWYMKDRHNSGLVISGMGPEYVFQHSKLFSSQELAEEFKQKLTEAAATLNIGLLIHIYVSPISLEA